MKIKSTRNQKDHHSPLRYPGGKTFLFPLFSQIIKKNGLRDITYIEPFAGGAGAALALLFSEKVSRIIINDFDKAIYSFWKSAVYDSERFIQKTRATPVTIKERQKQKAIYNNSKSSQFDLGFATFFLNRTNMSGILNGGPIGGLAQNGKWKINARFNKKMLIEKIRRLAEYRCRISVMNQDGVQLIKTYLNKKNVFVYLDPPYFDKGSTLYLNHYKKLDHEQLANQLNRHPDSFWLLTYDKKREIKSLYSERRIVKYSLNYNAYESRRGNEMLILSDALTV